MNASKTVVPYINITARLDTVADQELLQEKGGRGFPYITLMNGDGDVVWEFWPADKDAFDTAHKWASQLAGVMKQAAEKPDDKALAAAAALLDACGRSQRPQSMTFAELETSAKVEGVNPEILAMYKPKRIEMAMGSARQDGGKAVYELFKSGAKATGGQAIGFYYYGAMGAIAAKDVESANKLVDHFEAEGMKNKRWVEQVTKDSAKFREQIRALTPTSAPTSAPSK